MKNMLGEKYSITEYIVDTSIGNKSIILNTENGQYYELNQSSTFIWDALKKDLSRDEIIKTISNKFNLDQDHAMQSVENFISKCKGLGFIKVNCEN